MEHVDPLHDIHHYSPTFTITQILKFSERKDLRITRPMVQNYIRDGLLPPPKGRLYTHKHLAALVLIQRLKVAFDMPAIKTALVPFYDAEGLPLETYNRLMKTLAAANEQWKKCLAPLFAQEGEGEKSAAMAFLSGMVSLLSREI
jgi:DNA-binding transcriptional MerR regulator